MCKYIQQALGAETGCRGNDKHNSNTCTVTNFRFHNQNWNPSGSRAETSAHVNCTLKHFCGEGRGIGDTIRIEQGVVVAFAL